MAPGTMIRPPYRGARVGLLALVAVLSACGVRPQSSPSTIEPDDVPFGLVEPDPATPRPETGGSGTTPVTIFLVRTDVLVPAEREVTHPPGPRKLLRALAEGPTAEELAGGLNSGLDVAAPPSARRAGERILVELHEGFFTEGGPQIPALAQIVYTLTELEPDARVQFLLDGAPAEVPRGDGVLTRRAVDRSDYAAFEPAPTPLPA